MSTLQITILAIIQGITEFLPISSSGHLLVTPYLLGWKDQGLLMDVAVHVGTLGAVIVYLRRDVTDMAMAPFRLGSDEGRRGLVMIFYLVAATIPIVIAGFLVKQHFGNGIRSVALTGWATLGFGVLLYLSDRVGMTYRRMEHMKLGAAVAIGLSQILALIPGASRSGTTMTAARFLGFERSEAARFSMLLSIPAILGAGTLGTLDVIESGDAQLQADVLLAIVLSFVAALVSIMLMMRWLARATFMPFVIYRLVLGTALLVWWYW